MGIKLISKLVGNSLAALASILPPEDIDLLSGMSLENREMEIRKIIQIALGIRIFNKTMDPENSSDGLPDCETFEPVVEVNLTF